jgi:hypothetical protein
MAKGGPHLPFPVGALGRICTGAPAIRRSGDVRSGFRSLNWGLRSLVERKQSVPRFLGDDVALPFRSAALQRSPAVIPGAGGRDRGKSHPSGSPGRMGDADRSLVIFARRTDEYGCQRRLPKLRVPNGWSGAFYLQCASNVRFGGLPRSATLIWAALCLDAGSIAEVAALGAPRAGGARSAPLTSRGS